MRIATALFDWVSFGSRRPHAFDEGEAPLTRAQERGFVRASKATVRGGCCSGCGVAHSCNSQQSRCRPKCAPGNCFPYEKAIGIREADAPVAFWNRRALKEVAPPECATIASLAGEPDQAFAEVVSAVEAGDRTRRLFDTVEHVLKGNATCPCVPNPPDPGVRCPRALGNRG